MGVEVLFTIREQSRTMTPNVRECSLTSQPYIRYVEVMLGSRLTFTLHAQQVTGLYVAGAADARHWQPTARSKKALSLGGGIRRTHIQYCYLRRSPPNGKIPEGSCSSTSDPCTESHRQGCQIMV
uniref:Uncharacterized protein n=1 Tax=Bracon brevicornis TaxID=1563983 RepID=A0A6V7JIK0_9HYME